MLAKRFVIVGLLLIFTLGIMSGCGKDNKDSVNGTSGNTSSGYKDGIYFAQQQDFDESSGWKYMVTLEVKDGKIADADWNGAHFGAGKDKKSIARDGEYGMIKNSKIGKEWHEQAETVEAYLIQTQDPAKITYINDAGNTDAITGATIHVKEFFDLAKEALDNGLTGKGKFKDGYYTAEEEAFSESGWKEKVNITVVNGYVVSVYWTADNKEGGEDKYVQSVNGKYGMKDKGNAKAEWHEQADLVTAYLLKNQDVSGIKVNDSGKTDSISGASIAVSKFVELANKALDKAK